MSELKILRTERVTLTGGMDGKPVTLEYVRGCNVVVLSVGENDAEDTSVTRLGPDDVAWFIAAMTTARAEMNTPPKEENDNG